MDHHEHHGECCQPYEHHEPHEHGHVALSLGQLCCAGACNHPEHQGLLQQQLQAQMLIEQLDDAGGTGSKRKKKSKRKALGLYSLAAATAKA